MNAIISIYGVAIILIAFVCIYNLVHYVRYYSQFKAFNDNVSTWAKELDSSMKEALFIQSRNLLMEMDEKINVKNEETENNDNNLEEND